MMKVTIGVLALVGMVMSAGAKPGQPEPASVTAAVASKSRSADNVKLDDSRKPAELLKFMGLKRGMHVADMFGGNLYWAEITAPVVGPTGSVTIWEPTQFYQGDTKTKLDAFVAAHPNVRLLAQPFEAPRLPAKAFDFMLINLDYHDVYWESSKFKVVRMDPDAWLKQIYASVKPGGIVGVVDHAAHPGGDTRAVVDKLHRIDPAVVLADFKRTGFVLDGQSGMYRNPADDHGLLVFDPKIRGKTDRFVFRFRKPH